MKSEINFYEVEDQIVKSIVPLLLKILDEKKKVLIFSTNKSEIEEIDKSLWSYGKNKFIPHITIFDKNFDVARQPILLTDQEHNSNGADYLVFLSEPSKKFLENFNRSFYFFSKKNLTNEIIPTNFYKKENGKWIKIS